MKRGQARNIYNYGGKSSAPVGQGQGCFKPIINIIQSIFEKNLVIVGTIILWVAVITNLETMIEVVCWSRLWSGWILRKDWPNRQKPKITKISARATNTDDCMGDKSKCWRELGRSIGASVEFNYANEKYEFLCGGRGEASLILTRLSIGCCRHFQWKAFIER